MIQNVAVSCLLLIDICIDSAVDSTLASSLVSHTIDLTEPDLHPMGMKFIPTKAITADGMMADAIKIRLEGCEMQDFMEDEIIMYLSQTNPSDIYLQLPTLPSSTRDEENWERYAEMQNHFKVSDVASSLTETTHRAQVVSDKKRKSVWHKFTIKGKHLTNDGFNSTHPEGRLEGKPIYVKMKDQPVGFDDRTKKTIFAAQSQVKLVWFVAESESQQPLQCSTVPHCSENEAAFLRMVGGN